MSIPLTSLFVRVPVTLVSQLYVYDSVNDYYIFFILFLHLPSRSNVSRRFNCIQFSRFSLVSPRRGENGVQNVLPIGTRWVRSMAMVVVILFNTQKWCERVSEFGVKFIQPPDGLHHYFMGVALARAYAYTKVSKQQPLQLKLSNLHKLICI